MNEMVRRQAIALYDRYTHEGMERRDFMRRMVALAGSTAAAEALIMTIGADPAKAGITTPDDPRLIIRKGNLAGTGLNGYIAAPRGEKPLPALLVIHENRGLNAHIEDVARRFALEGYFAVAPDFLTPLGGTPADEDAARAAIGKLDLGKSVGEAVTLLDRIPRLRNVTNKVGAVGFCWGGAFVTRLAVAAGSKLAAGVAYYGPAPAPSEAAKVKSPLLLHYAGLDERVNASGQPWVAALKAAKKDATAYTYPAVNHAFNNDTSAERYDKAAADLAWKRTLDFFARHLRA